MYRVIIVEDEPEIARGTKEYVEKNPEFQVKAIFSNGQEALNYIWLNPVDLIVLDLFMPKMNGKEFLYRLRKENFQVDVIVVTAASDAGNIREVLPFGVVDYLLKPFEAARFAEALERFEQRHRILNAMSGLDQKGIDTVFSTPGEAAAASRRDPLERKGLREEKYQALLDCLDAQGETALSAETLADRTGLSRVTVRRYLSELIEAHEVASSVDITTGPKPVMVYRRRGKGTK